jgi:hypothetical protein
VKGHVATRKIGGHLKLANLNAQVSDLLRWTLLNKFFEVYDDDLAAIKSFSVGGEPTPSEFYRSVAGRLDCPLSSRQVVPQL